MEESTTQDSAGMEDKKTEPKKNTMEDPNGGTNAKTNGDTSKGTKKAEDGFQIFNDPIHGFIKLHSLLVAIIHTPQFERLKDKKQLGLCYWVYPGASHNRFEHCLGTAHLCGKLIDTLRELHREKIEITDEESLCVKIAGLCRDLGHGPFSHFFEKVYIPYMIDKKKISRSAWKHEEASCRLFDMIVKSKGVAEKFSKEFGADEKKYKDFIKDLISGKDPETDKTEIPVCSKTQKRKWFLYEIVSNKRNGIDCNKFDYFARDCVNVGVKSNFDCRRYFETIRILPIDDRLQICVRDKEDFNLYELFHTRWSLHHRVYQHKTQAPIEDLLRQAFEKVDTIFHISKVTEGTDEAMERFTVLTDSVIYDILRSENPLVSEAQELIRKIQRRELYTLCGQTQLTSDQSSPSEEAIVKALTSIPGKGLKEEQIFVKIIKIDFGKGDENPVDNVIFFDKSHIPRKIPREQVSPILPQKFNEIYVRMYAKKSRDDCKLIWECFKKWCSDNKYPVPQFFDPTGYIIPEV